VENASAILHEWILWQPNFSIVRSDDREVAQMRLGEAPPWIRRRSMIMPDALLGQEPF
jgi:hypothetical protein